MATDLERLTATFDADITRFEKKMDKLGLAYEKQSQSILRKHTSLIAKLNSGFNSISLGKLASLVGGTALLDRLVEGSKSLTEATLSASRATGISAENIQGLGIIARQSGSDQESLNKSLETFTANLGLAQVKQTDFGKLMSQMGVNIRSGPYDALLQLSAQIGKLPQAQQDLVAKMAFGRNGIGDLAWLKEGPQKIQATISQFQKMGIILPAEKLERMEVVFRSLEDVKLEALTGFMQGFSEFAGEIGTPAFQGAIKTFGEVMGEVSGAIVKIAPYIPQLIELYATFNAAKGGAMIGGSIGSLIGPEGTALGIGLGGLAGGAAGYFGSRAMFDHFNSEGRAVMAANAGIAKPPTGNLNLSGFLDRDEIEKAKARIEAEIAALNKELNQQLAESVNKAEDAYDNQVKAANDALLEQHRTFSDFYDIQKQVINQTAELDITRIKERRDADLSAIQDRQAAQIASLNAQIVSAKQIPDAKVRKTEVANLQAEVTKINEAADQEYVNRAAQSADEIIAINARKNQELLQNDYQYQQSLQNLVTVNDTLRDGLTQLAEAGLHGFGNLKEAASNFLESLAQIILKLYVMQPLLNGLLGPPGTSGGGILGGFLGNLFGPDLATATTSAIAANPLLFADGGVFAPGRGSLPLKRFAAGGVSNEAAIFGEAGIEAAVPLPDGRSIPVSIRMPSTPRATPRSQIISNTFDLRGAVMTQDLLEQMNQISKSHAAEAGRQAVGISIRESQRQFPVNLSNTLRDRG